MGWNTYPRYVKKNTVLVVVQSYADALLYQTDGATNSEGTTRLPATSSAPGLTDMQPGHTQQQESTAPVHTAPAAAPGPAASSVCVAQHAEVTDRQGRQLDCMSVIIQLPMPLLYVTCQPADTLGYSDASPNAASTVAGFAVSDVLWFVTYTCRMLLA